MPAPPVPLHVDTPSGWCFGWYHPPAQPWRDLAVVLCPPIGHEAVCSQPSYLQLASHFADAGFPVLRFDWQGTGDSSGDDHEPGRVDAWLASVQAAIAEARGRSGAAHVALFGLRLGATLATAAAARCGGVDSLVLWAPCATGRAFVRELRAVGSDVGDGALLAMGHHFRADTLADLTALDPTKQPGRPAARALVIGRDDLPAEGPLPRVLTAQGVDTAYRVLPGYGGLVGEPREGGLTPDTLAQLTAWLEASPAARTRDEPARLHDDDLEAWPAGPVRESCLLAGPGASLVGVLAEPAGGPTGRAGQTGVVLLNVGGNYRVGPHRVYVHAARAMAAAGYRVLRLDLAGIGDSPPAPGKPWASLYDRDSVQDVRAALDALALRGCREFVLMGICSGSYVAFQSALADPRVDGVVLMNSRLLEWTPGKAGDRWQDSMQQYVKSTSWYRRALLRPEVWRRLLRGEVHVRPIAARFASLAAARVRRLFTLGSDGGEDTLLGKMKRLCRRGTDVLMLVSDADDGRDYVEFHFGAAGRRLRASGNFRMDYVPEADHTFSRPGNQAHVLPLLVEHLRRRPPRQRGDEAPPAAALWRQPAHPGG